MSSAPYNRKTVQKKLLRLGERLDNNRHQTTGRQKYPRISNNTNFVDPVTYENVLPFNAWYIVPNAADTGKVHQVFNRKTLNAILAQPQPRRISPITRTPFTAAEIRRMWNNFRNVTSNNGPVQAQAQAHAANVINLTHSPSSNPSAPRLRRSVTFTHPHITRLVNYMRALPGNRVIKIKTNDQRSSHRSLIIDKSGTTFYIRGSLGSGLPRVDNVPYPTIITTLMTYISTHFQPNVLYMGYSRLR
jgi:hypothetical protein